MGVEDQHSNQRMKAFLFLILPCLLNGAPQPQGGLFQSLSSAVNNFFSGSNTQPRRPQQQQAMRGPPPQGSPQQRPPQNFDSQPQFQQPQQPSQSFQSQNSFTQTQAINPAPQSTFSRPSNPAPSFQAQGVRSNSFSSSSSNSISASNLGSVNGCSASSRAPNFAAVDTETGRNISYVVTWKFGETCSKFTQSEARQYCNLMNMEPVTLNTPNKQDTFNRLIAQDAQRYMWTGGEVDHSSSRISWNNNNQASISFSDSAHWSHTGGASPPVGQPDNRAAGENPPSPEVCLAILNNFYADGIKWHDVACHHRKPTVCEPRIQ